MQPEIKLADGITVEEWHELREPKEQPAQEPVAHIKQGMDGYPKLVFNGTFQYDSISAKQSEISLYTKEQL